MADGSPIEWLQKPGYKGATWNPTRGCSRQGPGCANCWAINMARRQDRPGGAYEGLTTVRNGKLDWLGVSRPAPDKLDAPLHWREPRMIFVESMGDLFHPGIPFEYIAACFGVMAATPQHIHVILTKQPKRARAFFEWLAAEGVSCGGPTVNAARGARWYAWNYIDQHRDDFRVHDPSQPWIWPLQNVWLLVSAWDQPSLEKYSPDLYACPAAVRGLSLEPLLGPIGLARHLPHVHGIRSDRFWVIAGGESGHGARPMQLAWARSLRDQCVEASVPFFFKQWGNHGPDLVRLRSKKEGGRLLDGRTWDEFPRYP